MGGEGGIKECGGYSPGLGEFHTVGRSMNPRSQADLFMSGGRLGWSRQAVIGLVGYIKQTSSVVTLIIGSTTPV